MTITISIFLYIFLVAVFIFILYSLFDIYHLLRFGFLSFGNIFVIIVYVIIASAFLLFAFNLLVQIDWSTPILNFTSVGWTNFNFLKI